MGKGRKLKIFSGTTSVSLAQEVCEILDIPLGTVDLGRFRDGEIHTQLLEDVREADVFIIGSTSPPAENFFEMGLLTDAARRSSADRITIVPTYLGYNRQDRKDCPRVPISAKFAIDVLTIANPNRALLVELHSEVTMGFFNNNIVVDHLYASISSIPYLKKMLGEERFIVASPDKGGIPRAKAYAKRLNNGKYVVFDKTRPEFGAIDEDSIIIIGDVKGYNVLFVDDIADSGKTLIANAKAAKAAGACKIYAYATHFLGSGGAIAKFDESLIDELVITNTIPHSAEELKTSRIKVTTLSIASLLAKAIRRIHDGDSLTSLFLPK